ncbi:MAG: hypothetical protein GC186_00280 [Rhodobacteraceae bacterium]|nr:hypothetical protein [Paracoccaceae bacterium]
MAELTLVTARIQDGIWTGELTAVADGNYQPDIEVTHLETPVAGVAVAQVPGRRLTWSLRIPIPSAALSEGVQTILIRDRRTGTRLGSFAILTGAPLEDDIRAEVDLLRAELDMLKRAFRRHCVETAG